MISRRAFIATVGGGLLAAPVPAQAQQAGRIYRIGALSTGGSEQEKELQATLRERLRERGWVEGQNLLVEWRYAEGNYGRLPELIEELVSLKPDVLMTRGGPGTAAAKRVTTTIPVVMWNTTDPVGIGVVASLSRPGGNVTGLSDDPSSDIMGKRLQLLKEVAPEATKVAILTRVPPSTVVPRVAEYERALETGAAALGVQIRFWRLQGPGDVDRAFPEIARDGFRALNVEYVPVTWANRRQIAAHALRYRVPAIYWHRTYVVDGGLMAYGPDEREVPQRLAGYLDKILRGTKPADLPVEQPSKIELVINLKTARAIGVVIPPSVLQRADQVLE